jgi:protein translocase SecG subunit
MNYLKLSQILQIIFTVLLVGLTLIQSKGAGLAQGLKGSFGGYRSIRGAEKAILILTIVISILFVANSLFLIVLS